MPVVGPLATNVRRSLQRQPAASPNAGPQTLTLPGSQPLLGLARSAAARTSVLPQARVQRDENPPTPQNQIVPYSQPQPSGTLPLAPHGPAPVNPNQGAPTTPPTPTPGPTTSRPSQSLTLAPVIARDGGSNGSSPTSSSSDEGDSELDDLLSGLDDDALSDAGG